VEVNQAIYNQINPTERGRMIDKVLLEVLGPKPSTLRKHENRTWKSAKVRR